MYLLFSKVKNRDNLGSFVAKRLKQNAGDWARGSRTHHLVVDFMEVNLTDFVDHVLVLVGDEAEASVSVRLLVEHQHRILNLKETSPHTVKRKKIFLANVGN
jgi:hypothetical protein